MAEDRQDRLVPTIEALIEIQKRTLSTLGTVTGRFDKIDMEMTKITRQGLKLESELASFRSDATARLDAIGRRLEELEQLADQNATDIREAKSEILTQQNEILNAMQAGLDYRSAINDIKERLAELERRVGL